MALGSCYTCIKYLMFAFNFIFWLLGCAILGVGIWLKVDDKSVEYMQLSSDRDMLHTVAIVLIVIGFAIMLIGFLGCCGAIRESQCMLMFFFFFLFVIFACLLGFGIWAAVEKNRFHGMAREILKKGVEKYHEDQVSREYMDFVQHNMECCGYDKGLPDYPTTKIFDTMIENKDLKPQCELKNSLRNCTDPLYNWFKDRLIVVAGIAIGIAVVMILGMIFSMVLCCAIRDSMA